LAKQITTIKIKNEKRSNKMYFRGEGSGAKIK
jgi:hypothetical protein